MLSEASAGPLAGVKVIELGTLIAGPLCGRMLADFGAEVIKIEAPEGGDQIRQWRKMYEGTSLWWYPFEVLDVSTSDEGVAVAALPSSSFTSFFACSLLLVTGEGCCRT